MTGLIVSLSVLGLTAIAVLYLTFTEVSAVRRVRRNCFKHEIGRIEELIGRRKA